MLHRFRWSTNALFSFWKSLFMISLLERRAFSCSFFFNVGEMGREWAGLLLLNEALTKSPCVECSMLMIMPFICRDDLAIITYSQSINVIDVKLQNLSCYQKSLVQMHCADNIQVMLARSHHQQYKLEWNRRVTSTKTTFSFTMHVVSLSAINVISCCEQIMLVVVVLYVIWCSMNAAEL